MAFCKTIHQNSLKFMMATNLGKSLRPPMPKWSYDSTSRKTKDCQHHVLVTFVTQDLES